jgi:hypothetical protein
MSQFTDPFKHDTSKFRQLLDKDSPSNIQDAEIISEDVLSGNTIDGLPPSVFQNLKSQADKLQMDPEKKGQVAKVFNQLFSDLNQKYGLNVSMDFDSFTNNLNYMIEPNNKRAAEYYLSYAYGSFRVALYGQFLNAIALLSAQILDPSYILSDSMTYEDKMNMVERLFQFMEIMNTIYEKVNIKDTNVKLEKMSSDKKTKYDLNDPEVRSLMESMFKNLK